MEAYKEQFIQFLLETGALKVGGNYTLKSKRLSPWFVNIGDFNDGNSIGKLGEYYSKLILDFARNVSNGSEIIELLYGIPEKGNALAVSTSIALSNTDVNVNWFSTRKTPKEYGEATNLSQAERIKALVVGKAPKNGQSIIQLDDVFTAGDAKYQAREVLNSLGDFKLPLVAIAVDRQEVGTDGVSAIEEYEQKTGTRVKAVVTATEIFDYLKNQEESPFLSENLTRMMNYLRVYGTRKAQANFAQSSLEQTIIRADRSVIPACDVETLKEFEELVKQTADVEKIGGYKIGFELGLGYGLKKVVDAARKHTDKPIIYDHQKAGTDIPDTGENFARTMKKGGVDTVILFPQAGPETERAWIYHALDKGLNVIVGGRMTHPAYAVSEGGFITDEGALEMYRIAARAGINNFVAPGNKPEVIQQIRAVIEDEGVNPTFYAPGFIAQGGSISDAAKVAGKRFHGIVGRGIYKAEDMHKAAIEHTSQL